MTGKKMYMLEEVKIAQCFPTQFRNAKGTGHIKILSQTGNDLFRLHNKVQTVPPTAVSTFWYASSTVPTVLYC